jgi:ferric-dicitrate binding protein FerR (iron transport regulator)
MTTESQSQTDGSPTHCAMHHHRVQDAAPGGALPSEPLPARRRHRAILAAASATVACAACFAAGFWVGVRRLDARVDEAADNRDRDNA